VVRWDGQPSRFPSWLPDSSQDRRSTPATASDTTAPWMRPDAFPGLPNKTALRPRRTGNGARRQREIKTQPRTGKTVLGHFVLELFRSPAGKPKPPPRKPTPVPWRGARLRSDVWPHRSGSPGRDPRGPPACTWATFPPSAVRSWLRLAFQVSKGGKAVVRTTKTGKNRQEQARRTDGRKLRKPLFLPCFLALGGVGEN